MGRLLRVGRGAGNHVRGSKCDPLVHTHELLVGGRVSSLRASDELRLVGGRPTTRMPYTENGSAFHPAPVGLRDLRSLARDGLEAAHRRDGGEDGDDPALLLALEADELARLAEARLDP